MIRVDGPVPEPAEFEEKCRKPGRKWVRGNWKPGKTPPNLWRQFHIPLAEAFQHRCAYQAIWINLTGNVDHYISVDSDKDQIYEWSNYRYCGAAFNSSKQNLDDLIPDPFKVQDDWFEVILPSCQLILTDNFPEEQREQTQRILIDGPVGKTHQKPGLLNREKVVESRKNFYKSFKDGKVSLETLLEYAPQVARAVQKHASSSLT